MTMLISKFNRLIHNRKIWWALLILIILSFVVWQVQPAGEEEDGNGVNAAGLLDGQPVSFGEFRSAYLSTYLARALALGREVENTPESEALLRRLSWQRLATLREAAKLGIATTEEELVGAIRSNFADTNGVYRRDQYQAFLNNLIRPMGFTDALFEQHIREEIAIQKLGLLIGRQAHVTPLEVRRTFETLLDEFTVEYAVVRPADVEAGVAVTEEDARKLYDTDPQAFALPEQRVVSYAAFPIADFTDAQAEIAEDAVLDYYELHINDYTTEEAGPDGQPRETVADLEDVRAGIVQALRREAALERAESAATTLTSRAIPDRDGAVPDFAAEAEAAGRPAQTLPPFARFEVPLADAGAAFAAAAFDLAPNAYERVSGPVTGDDNIYVIYLQNVLAPRIPAFDEVREQALGAARRTAVADAMTARARAIQEAAAAGIAAGKSFADAVAAADATPIAAEPFTGLSGSSSTNEAVQALVQAVVGYNQGEVTDPAPSETGLVVAYLKARTPADPATFDAYQAEIASAIRSRRAQGLFREWQAELLAPARFTDLQRPAAGTDDQDEGADEEPDEESAADAEPDAAAAEPM